MASIRREAEVNARAENVWDALRDMGALHRRLAPGFVMDTKMEEGARVVTFANGMTVRELIVDVDDERAAARLVRGCGSRRLTHHNASLQVFAEGDGRAGSSGSRTCCRTKVACYIEGDDRAGHGRDEADAGALASGGSPISRVHWPNHSMTSLWSGIPWARRCASSSASESPG